MKADVTIRVYNFVRANDSPNVGIFAGSEY